MGRFPVIPAEPGVRGKGSPMLRGIDWEGVPVIPTGLAGEVWGRFTCDGGRVGKEFP